MPLLINKEALYFPFKANDNFVTTINNIFSTLLHAKDKQDVNIPFMACAPGSGKTRTLQEIYSKTKFGSENRENSLEILISFGNGTVLREEEKKHGYEMALCGRILYAYLEFIEFYNYHEFFLKFWQHVQLCTFHTVILGIAEHWRKTHSKVGQNIYIYLAIDEFTNATDCSYSTDRGTRTFLDGIINIIGNYIINSKKSNNYLFPFFAGLDYKLFTSSIAKSTFNCEFMNPYKFKEQDEIYIAEKYFPELRYSYQLWKVFMFCDKRPRLIVWLIKRYQETKDIKNAYKKAAETFNTTYHLVTISQQVAKWILAHTITQQIIEIVSEEVSNGLTIKKLEENGWISLVVHKNGFTVTSPLPVLYSCCTHIGEKKLFIEFLNLLQASAWTKQTTGNTFEKFNGLFDCVLNTCFIYLGNTSVTVAERFRGARFGDYTNTSLQIELASGPKKCDFLSQVSFTNSNEKFNIPENTMIVNAKQECFFDRFMTMNIMNENKYMTVLWQDRGTEKDLPNFQQKDMELIVTKHFTQEKLSIIGVNKNYDNTLSLIVTTKGGGSVNIPKNFGVIDGMGLRAYYGSYIFKLYCFHLPLPFPINKYEMYSDYDLAIFLGIPKKQATTLRNRIMLNGEIMDLQKLQNFTIDTNQVLWKQI